jgi:transposase
MHVIGEETSERLDVIPAQFQVIVTHRPNTRVGPARRSLKRPRPNI